jgi:hypothetical protein
MIGNGKELLLQEKELAQWWVAVKNDPRFKRILMFTLFEITAGITDMKVLEGAREGLALLETITDNPADSQVQISSGLDRRSPEQITSDWTRDRPPEK